MRGHIDDNIVGSDLHRAIHRELIWPVGRQFEIQSHEFWPVLASSGSVTSNGICRDSPAANLNLISRGTIRHRWALVNRKVAAMTSSDWSAVQALAAAGMTRNDYTLQWGVAPAGIPDLTKNFGFLLHPMMLHTVLGGLSFVSERLMQDVKPGDLRLNAFKPYPGGAVVNVLNRGIQFGTRFIPIDIEDTSKLGRYSTESYDPRATVPIAPTWEETALMIAEADIYSGSIDAGLQLIDKVRASQGAGLPLLAGSGISQTAAIAQLHSERRIGLYLHNEKRKNQEKKKIKKGKN